MPQAKQIPTSQHVRLVLVLAAVLWSLSGLIVKSPPLAVIPLDVRGPLLACYRALFAGLLLLPFVPRSAMRWTPGLVPMVIAFALMNVLFVSSMTRTTSAAAIFLQYTATAWVALISWAVLRERLARSTGVALVAAIGGISWIVIAEHASGRAAGNILALGSGFSLSCTFVMIRILRNENAVWLTALNHVFGGLVLLPWIWFIDLQLTHVQWAVIVLLGIVQMGLPYVLFTWAVRHLPATEAVLITLLEPIMNPIWVWLAWREAASPHVIFGGLLIIGGLVIKYALLERKMSVDHKETFN